MSVNLTNIIDQVGKDKGIDKNILIEALESAMLKAAEKRFGPNKIIEAHYQEDAGEIELFLFKTVVEEAENPDLEISFDQARELDPEVALGDSLGVKLDAKEFGRIDAQTAKQIIIQKVREAERNIIFSEYSSKKGEIITGIVQRFEKGDIIVDLGRAEAVVPKKEQVRREGYRQGERIRGIVLDVKSEAKGPQIILSRTHPGFLMKLFQMEVPEIYEGIVEIKGAAREPGDRAKIAVISNNADVDPVGACVGVKGSRVQAVVQELKGEKIDIVHWSDDHAIFVKNTLSPAQISRVITDDAEHAMEVIVPDDQLSLAIGKKGQNVRLAAKLTGWKIDIRTESESKGAREGLTPDEALRKEVLAADAREEKERAAALKVVEDFLHVTPEVAGRLIEAGYNNAESLLRLTRERLEKIEIGEEDMERILDAIQDKAGNR
ncbi:MAG: transcription termination/antitermination protein NusA [Deltaproteobacteria bacterium]|nr:transcription termination/antitermination protein NusA [Deltaproteobacteria bacterium]